MSKTPDKIGIYQIECLPTGKIYIGSSGRIYRRWSSHRWALRRGKNGCVLLQRSWDKYGEKAFRFSIIEECPRQDLWVREQHYVDALRPALNILTDIISGIGKLSPEVLARRAATLRARAARITHCPHGHKYTPENTYRNKKNKRICRQCNAERVAAIYAKQTPEQTAVRKARARKYNNTDPGQIAKRAAYAAAHKAEKREYDRQYRARMNASP